MIYYVLDAVWDDNRDARLGEYLSSANPFLFDGIGSAVPDVFSDFCEKITEPVTVENSYAAASAYIASLENKAVSEAFSAMKEKEWLACTKAYLSEPHKGQ